MAKTGILIQNFIMTLTMVKPQFLTNDFIIMGSRCLVQENVPPFSFKETIDRLCKSELVISSLFMK